MPTLVVILVLYIAAFEGPEQQWNQEISPVAVGKYHTMQDCERIRKEIHESMVGKWTIKGPRPDRISQCISVPLTGE